MWPGERANLQKEGSGQANGDRGTATQAAGNWNGGAERVQTPRETLGSQGQEQIQECKGRVIMDLPDTLGLLWGDVGQVEFQSRNELRVERRDQVIVVLLLTRSRKRGPRQVIDVPSVCQIDIGKSERDGPFGFGERGDEEVGTERHGRRNCRL